MKCLTRFRPQRNHSMSMYPLTPLARPADSRCLSLELPEGRPERLRRGDSTPVYPVYPPSTPVYPSSTPQQQQQLTSIRRAQPSSSSRQEVLVSRALPAGANVRFLCRGVSPPSPHQTPRQPAAPPKLQQGNHLSASMRQTLSLLPSPQQQHQAAQLKHSSLTLATPPPGPNSSREAQTPDEDPPQQKCQHQLPTSRVTGACCLLRSRGDPPVLRRGQAVQDSV